MYVLVYCTLKAIELIVRLIDNCLILIDLILTFLKRKSKLIYFGLILFVGYPFVVQIDHPDSLKSHEDKNSHQNSESKSLPHRYAL